MIFAERAPGGGPVIEVVARARQQARIDGGMFDTRGRAIRIAPVGIN